MASHKLKKYSIADTADIHELYELSVQNSEAEIDFVDHTYKKLRKKKATLLREDFCGTANVCCEWVKRRKTNQAIGVDLDTEVLAWSRKNQVGKLAKKYRQKITLIEANVLDVETAQPDIVSAMNFSYWLLKEPDLLRAYFENVYRSLKDDGVFFLDAYGGYDAFKEIEERTWH
jgi:SAM-dependent methyltransferase